MHLPNFSSTLPRRWRATSSQGGADSSKKPALPASPVVSSKKPPKSTTLTRRFSVTSSKPPRPTISGPQQVQVNSNTATALYRSSSFTSDQPGNPNVLVNNRNDFDFKKPLPPHPASQPPAAKNPPTRTPSFLSRRKNRRESGAGNTSNGVQRSVPFNEDKRSQSLVDIAQDCNSSGGLGQPEGGGDKCCNCRHRSMSFDYTTSASGQGQVRQPLLSTFSSHENIPCREADTASLNNEGRKSQSSLFSGHRNGHSSSSKPCTASIFSRNLRSNSWRNLTSIGRMDSGSSKPFGGMNKQHRLSSHQGAGGGVGGVGGAKKVTPPSIPNILNPRGSGSSFGSDYSYDRSGGDVLSLSETGGGGVGSFSRDPSGANTSTDQRYLKPQHKSASGVATGTNTELPVVREQQSSIVVQGNAGMDHDQGIDMTLSPGRDSPGDDSSASIGTVESSSYSSGGVGGGGGHSAGGSSGSGHHPALGPNSGGIHVYRNSTTSLDSGRASNNESTATMSTFTGGVNTAAIQPIHEHRALVNVHPATASARFMSHHNSTTGSFHGGSSGGAPSPAPSGGGYRQSLHSSTSSLGSGSNATGAEVDSICALNIPEMVANGVADHEILLAWLTDLHYEEYYDLFMSAGYDMPTICRMTPEDLTAIGIKKPNHRKRLKAEITRLNIPDGLPNYIPNSLEEWLYQIRLSEYAMELLNQGYRSVSDVATISIEDLEDVGLFKLGHQKRFLLAVKRIKELKSGRRAPSYPTPQSSTGSSTFMPNNGSCQQQQQPRQLPPAPPVRKLSTTSTGDSNGLYSTFQRQNSGTAFHVNVQQHRQPDTAAVTAAVDCHQQPQLPSPSKAVTTPPKPIHYQPDIICIDQSPSRRPSNSFVNGVGRQLQENNSQQPGDTEEGSPPPPSPPAMPAPMAPINSSWAARMRQLQHTTTQQPSDMVRSFDDSNVDMLSHYGAIQQQQQQNPQYGVRGGLVQQQQQQPPQHHSMALSSQNVGGGGTLPRALVKPRPIAKISAILSNPQQGQLHQSDFQSSDLCKKTFASSSDNLKQTSGGSSQESFPFANDNMGTIRMRQHNLSGGSATQLSLPLHFTQTSQPMPHPQDSKAALMAGPSQTKRLMMSNAQQQQQPNGVAQHPGPGAAPGGGAGGNRTAGDVLNDIGSMLADLTDELDAMLHMEREAGPGCPPASLTTPQPNVAPPPGGQQHHNHQPQQ